MWQYPWIELGILDKKKWKIRRLKMQFLAFDREFDIFAKNKRALLYECQNFDENRIIAANATKIF